MNNLLDFKKSSHTSTSVSLSDLVIKMIISAIIGTGVFAFRVWLAVVILRAMGVL